MANVSINAINLEAKDLDQSIYRIVPIKRLVEMFVNRRNGLVKPRKWQDPFENFVFKNRFVLPTGKTLRPPMADSFFGQCWTTKSQSDAMWRLYSDKNQGIRIRTTIRKLYLSLHNHAWPEMSDRLFIGKVRYQSKSNLLKSARQIFSDERLYTGIDWAKTFLLKRSAFSHEREVRLLFFGYSEHASSSDVYDYALDPLVLVEDIVLDPRLDDASAFKMEALIRRKTNYRGRITRSDLYQHPKEFLVPFNGT
jgi:hypothetical protein